MKTVWIYDGLDCEIIPFSNPKKAYDKLASTGRLAMSDQDYPGWKNDDGLPSYRTFLNNLNCPENYNTVGYRDYNGDYYRVYRRKIQ